jgi:hypothetical protein
MASDSRWFSEAERSRLKTGDGAAVSQETSLTIAASERAEVLLFDLA